MAEKHLDPLFSAAYDGELDPAARRRFDTHVEGCDRCATAWDDYRAALDAVRALPAVAMPATVRLPLGPPQVEAGRAAFLERLRSALFHPQPVWAAAGLAAVSLAAVILAVHHPGGGGTGSPTSGSLAFGAAPYSHAGAPPQAPVPPGARDLAPEALGAVVPCPVAQVPPASGGAPSSGFAYSTRRSVGGGRELVLATPTDSYPPGGSVLIYARLTGGSTAGGTDVVPCVTLETFGGGAGAPAAAPAPQGGAGSQAQANSAAGAAPPATPIAVATTQPQADAPQAGGSAKTATGAGQLRVTIPAGVPHGTQLRLVALIPGYSSPTGLPLEIELVITVR